MKLSLALKSIGKRQLSNLEQVRHGAPLTYPPFVAGTVEPDDVALAEAWLATPDRPDAAAEITAYEAEFAAWNGSHAAVSFAKGRVALSAVIHALDLGSGDEVIVPGYTCVVVANAFRFAGVNIRYADIELDTYGLDGENLAQLVTPATKAIVVQHLYGLVARDYAAVVDFARERGLHIIEDCAHSTGAIYADRRVGNLGDVAFYSSEHSKSYSTFQGGMATTNDPELARRLRKYQANLPFPGERESQQLLRNFLLDYARFRHPQRWWRGDVALLRYHADARVSTSAAEEVGMRPPGYARRLPPSLAAIGRNQLRKLDGINARRRKSARQWDAWCEQAGYRKPLVIPGSTPTFLRYPVLVEPERKQDPRWTQAELGVEAGVWFTGSLHPVPGAVPDCPQAESAVQGCINLPTLLE